MRVRTVCLIIPLVILLNETVRFDTSDDLTERIDCPIDPKLFKLTQTPYIGMIAVYKRKMYVLERPKTMLHYPRLLTINEMVPVDEPQHLDEMSYLYLYHHWYGLWFHKDKQDNQEIQVRILDFGSLNTMPIDRNWTYFLSKVSNVSFIYTNANDVVDLVSLPSEDEAVVAVVYKDNNNQTTVKVKPSMSMVKGWVVDDHITEKVTTLVIYENTSESAFGIISYGKLYKHFLGTRSYLTFKGISPWFQNEVLLGCPPTLCIYSQFDAATVLTDGTIGLFFANHWWKLPDISGNIDLTPKNIADIPVFGLETRIKGPVAAAFVYMANIYLITKHEVWIGRLHKDRLTDFTKHRIQEVFPFMDRMVWLEEIDATIYEPQTSRLYVYQCASYLVWNLTDETLDFHYLHQFPLVERTFPRHLTDYQELPEGIDAGMLHESHFYFFYGTFMFKSKQTETVGERKTKVLLIQSSLIDCNDYDYAGEGIKEDYMKTLLDNFVPQANKERNAYPTIELVLTYSSLVIGLLVVTLLVTLGLANCYSRRMRQTLRRQCATRNRVVKERRHTSSKRKQLK